MTAPHEWICERLAALLGASTASGVPNWKRLRPHGRAPQSGCIQGHLFQLLLMCRRVIRVACVDIVITYLYFCTIHRRRACVGGVLHRNRGSRCVLVGSQQGHSGHRVRTGGNKLTSSLLRSCTVVTVEWRVAEQGNHRDVGLRMVGSDRPIKGIETFTDGYGIESLGSYTSLREGCEVLRVS